MTMGIDQIHQIYVCPATEGWTNRTLTGKRWHALAAPLQRGQLPNGNRMATR